MKRRNQSPGRLCKSQVAKHKNRSPGTHPLVLEHLWMPMQYSRESIPEKNIIITFQNQNRSAMSHDMALKLLGLSGGENKTRAGVSVVRFPNWVGEPD